MFSWKMLILMKCHVMLRKCLARSLSSNCVIKYKMNHAFKKTIFASSQTFKHSMFAELSQTFQQITISWPVRLYCYLLLWCSQHLQQFTHCICTDPFLVHPSILQANTAASNEGKAQLSILVLTAAVNTILLGKKFDGEISL